MYHNTNLQYPHFLLENIPKYTSLVFKLSASKPTHYTLTPPGTLDIQLRV